jgi:hypothetical protein
MHVLVADLDQYAESMCWFSTNGPPELAVTSSIPTGLRECPNGIDGQDATRCGPGRWIPCRASASCGRSKALPAGNRDGIAKPRYALA